MKNYKIKYAKINEPTTESIIFLHIYGTTYTKDHEFCFLCDEVMIYGTAGKSIIFRKKLEPYRKDLILSTKEEYERIYKVSKKRN